MNEQETLGRPVSESGTRITKAPAEDELGLTGVWERVRPTVMRNELPPQILLSFICSNSGKASAALSEGQTGAAMTLIEEQITMGLRALAQLRRK